MFSKDLQSAIMILRSVLKVKFTKYHTCARGMSGELGEISRAWTGFSIIVELEPYMLETYLRKNAILQQTAYGLQLGMKTQQRHNNLQNTGFSQNNLKELPATSNITKNHCPDLPKSKETNTRCVIW